MFVIIIQNLMVKTLQNIHFSRLQRTTGSYTICAQLKLYILWIRPLKIYVHITTMMSKTAYVCYGCTKCNKYMHTWQCFILTKQFIYTDLEKLLFRFDNAKMVICIRLWLLLLNKTWLGQVQVHKLRHMQHYKQNLN